MQIHGHFSKHSSFALAGKKRKSNLRPRGQEVGLIYFNSPTFIHFLFWTAKKGERGLGRGGDGGRGRRVGRGSGLGAESIHLCITNIGQKNLSNPTKRFYRVKVHKSTGPVEVWMGWEGQGRCGRYLIGGRQSVCVGGGGV